MASFRLKVLTAGRSVYDGEVDRIVIRTTQGDVGILPNHVPYVAAVGVGGLTVYRDGKKRTAAVAGGVIDVSREQTVVLARSCEWADEIDVHRAQEAAARARAAIRKNESGSARDTAQAGLKKALNRIRIAQNR